ncbi:hypothetical protein NIES4071_50030 [Calothrix sp. NIES-4071]|nr:hypothetical protein NIES4071_50030 [Calothrix sp. NIES-4071]BAZ59310.1 hypothetical protein NIES4105_49970 [Calothrix sp. NIES-4105]
MTLEWSGFTNKELLCSMPDSLQCVLKKVLRQHYEELYEPKTEQTASLSHAINEILQLFQDSNQKLTHLRYVWMGLILALVVEPTIKYYQPSSSIPTKTVELTSFWLIETSANMLESKKVSTFNSKSEIESLILDIKNNQNFSDSRLTSLQIWQEALDVYSNAIKTLDFNESLEALLEILDSCLEGYAIFPGSYGRRELFDWWLLEVVPASWYLLPPISIYTVNNIAEEMLALSQINILEHLSSAIWSNAENCEPVRVLFNSLPGGIYNNLIIRSASHARVGWDEAFTKMAKQNDDILVDDVRTTNWDNVEWEW